MNRKLYNKTFNVIKLFVLVISISLASAPMSVSHSLTQIDQSIAQVEIADENNSNLTDLKESSDCENHSTNSLSDFPNGPDTCCKAFCSTFALAEFYSESHSDFARPIYNLLPSSAVLPGVVSIPKRPPQYLA